MHKGLATGRCGLLGIHLWGTARKPSLVWNTALWNLLKGQGSGERARETAVQETEQLGLLAPALFSIYLLCNILDFHREFNVNE